MPTTRNVRDYGPIGNGNAANDQATFNAAVNASRSGDTLTVPYDSGGKNTILLKTNTNVWAGGTLAVDEGITFKKGDSANGPLFSVGSNLDTFLFTLLSTNGSNNGLGTLGKKVGRWGCDFDPATTLADPHSQFAAFKLAKHIQVEHMWANMNDETHTVNGVAGVATANQSSTAIFVYPGSAGVIGASDITIRDIVVFNAPAGYGPTQVQSGTGLYFYQVWSQGGKALRVEQDAGNLNHVDGLIADGIWGYHGLGCVALNPHAGWLHNATIKNVTSEECAEALRISTNFSAVVIDGAALLGSPNGSSNNAQVRNGGGSGLQVNFVPGPAQEDDSSFTASKPPAGVTLKNISSRGYWELNQNHAPHFPSDPWPFGAGFGPTPPGQKSKAISGGLAPSGALTKAKVGSPNRYSKSVAGALAPAGSLARKKLQNVATKPQLTRSPTNPSTDQGAFFVAKVTAPGNWRWQIDGGPVLVGQSSAMSDYRTFPVDRGTHQVDVWVVGAGGVAGPKTTYQWLVPDIQTPVPSPQNLLGCGAYTVYVTERGDTQPIAAALQWSELDWERGWSTPGAANITIDGLGNDPECCRTLDTIEPWQHELHIYRDDERVWEGPITYAGQAGETGKVEAMELSIWFARRRVHDDLLLAGMDATDAMLAIMESALRPDTSPNIVLVNRGAAGFQSEKTLAADTVKADSEIGELVRSGVGYAMQGRNVLAGTATGDPVATLLGASFAAAPQADKDGLALVNDLRLVADIVGDTSTSSDNTQLVGEARDQDSVQLYGLHEDVQTEQSITAQDQINAAALAQLEANKDTHVSIDSAVLASSAPVEVAQLVCGVVVDVRLAQCLSVLDVQRLAGVKATAGRDGTEQITVSVQTTSGVSEA